MIDSSYSFSLIETFEWKSKVKKGSRVSPILKDSDILSEDFSIIF
jgi:hypothetical protein